jgi:hypothetical protein
MKTKRTLTFLVLVAALLFWAASDVWGPSNAPQNQEPLFTLSPADFGEFVAAFDEAADGPRILLLLSPT